MCNHQKTNSVPPLSNCSLSGFTGEAASNCVNITSVRWKFCPECGKKLEADWTYCAGCGRMIGLNQTWFPVYPVTYPLPGTYPLYTPPYTITWTAKAQSGTCGGSGMKGPIG